MRMTFGGYGLDTDTKRDNNPVLNWPRPYRRTAKPGLSPSCVTAVALCFPISSIIWAGIIYGALRLAH
jgi:hypothetical protein